MQLAYCIRYFLELEIILDALDQTLFFSNSLSDVSECQSCPCIPSPRETHNSNQEENASGVCLYRLGWALFCRLP